jgi:hypothetical protein
METLLGPLQVVDDTGDGVQDEALILHIGNYSKQPSAFQRAVTGGMLKW